ncbi:hypothetical protein BDR06DRAFT_796596 [Suillus hirtellus]|nr:hypothetical protein BDR06DRAFT_796596 [Suillus hirtellus]
MRARWRRWVVSCAYIMNTGGTDRGGPLREDILRLPYETAIFHSTKRPDFAHQQSLTFQLCRVRSHPKSRLDNTYGHDTT